jgi:hypothetical protein
MTTQGQDTVATRVRAFYEALPFNYDAGEEAAAGHVRANPLRAYPDLDALLRTGGVRSVLDVGCGSGSLANSDAHH